MEEWLICMPKIYINASQYEEVKRWCERYERACRDEAENGVSFLLAGKKKESEDRHGGDVRSKCTLGPSSRGRSMIITWFQSLFSKT